LGQIIVPKRPNHLQIYGPDANSDEADEDDAVSYLNHSSAPSQVISDRQRPLSFYDMEKQQKQVRAGVPILPQRNSWRGSGEMPYNYADISGDDRFGYAPSKLGNRTRSQSSDNSPPAAPANIYLGLPWTMWMNGVVINMFVALVGEWIGTTL
jgi:hypothetical protein